MAFDSFFAFWQKKAVPPFEILGSVSVEARPARFVF
jgi:hypothetical protein